MLFELQGWIQGHRAMDKANHEQLCLGLQWKVSPSPMMPSGLVWTSDVCTKFGGYVCKKQSHRALLLNNQNKTIKGTEGHLTSPSTFFFCNATKDNYN